MTWHKAVNSLSFDGIVENTIGLNYSCGYFPSDIPSTRNISCALGISTEDVIVRVSLCKSLKFHGYLCTWIDFKVQVSEIIFRFCVVCNSLTA